MLIDSQGNIFLTGKHGQTTIGGFGTITIVPDATPTPTPTATPSATPNATPTPTPTPVASPTPTPTPTPTASPTPTPGEDEDDEDDLNTDPNERTINATFTVTLVNGEVITGNLTFRHGVIFGTFTWNGVVYTIRAAE